MRINSKRTKNFSEVAIGEVFSDDGLIAIKIERVYDDDDSPVNAIDLSDGTTLYYESFVSVTPLDAELNY